MPLTTVLEVSGAVLSWTIDDPHAGVHIAFTDPARADWFWQVVGDRGHAAVVSALEAAGDDGRVDVDGVAADVTALEPLRRLALGHWLRRWWPASRRDGIAELDRVLLDGELALLTAAAEDYFADDTFDSDVAPLLRPHSAMLGTLAGLGDPRVAELAAACGELADDIGVGSAIAASAARTPGRDDYALVAGAGNSGSAVEPIAAGVTSIHWGAVPPGVFDAAENTVVWSVESRGDVTSAVVRAELSGLSSPEGIAVRVWSAGFGGAGVLDSSGSAAIGLLDTENAPMSEALAWGHDWRDTGVTIGSGTDEAPEVRDRVRDVARARLRRPGGDAFLAEVLAAESDY
jgi:hypothetical protein